MNDLISRQTAIDDFYKYPNRTWTTLDVLEHINALPSAQTELSLEQVLEYCRSRCITVVEDEVLYKRLDSAYAEGYTYAESKYREMWDEIEHCKDCIHWKERLPVCNRVRQPGYGVNDFCSKGERREQ